MRALSRTEFQVEVEPVLQKIFVAGDNTFSPSPFASNVSVKRILFNWNFKYMVEPPLIDAVVTAAKHVGDDGFFYQTLWRTSPEMYPYAWYIPFSEIGAYKLEDSPISMGERGLSEQVIFSPSSQWGVMTTHEFHMLLGCNEAFVDVFRQLVPDLEEQIFSFLDCWKDYKINDGTRTDSWLPGLMKQVYGPETANKMLQEAGLP